MPDDPPATPAADDDLEGRVLLLAPTRKDAAAAVPVFAAAGLPLTPCADLEAVCDEIRRGAAVAVVPDEAIQADRDGCLARTLADQPPWSDFPLIVLTPPQQPAAAAERLERVGPMTLVPRPVEIRALLSTIRAAVRDRRRQYARRADLAERERQAEALRDADRRKDEFLAMLAHELRNPLAAVHHAVAVLKRDGDDAEGRDWAAGVVERQVQQLVHLIDDLLDVARITSGKVRLRPEPVDARVVLDRAVEAARPLIDARGHALRVAIAEGPLPLHVDVARIEQAVLNLLTNAAKYTDPGGHIWLDAGREADRVVVRVRDDGAGIPPDRLPEMFRLFAQGDRSLARSEGGLGIGLTIVQTLVELHGGAVEAYSDGPGRGSAFTVRLPLADPPPPAGAAAPAAPPAAATAPAARVLVVDDNVDTARGLARLLSLHGHAVATAHDGPAALEAAREFRPGVVLLDIGLPGLDGYEVARRLRADADLRSARLIAVSGYGQEDDRRRSRAAGFDAHLVKPVDLDTLLALLR